MTVSELDSSKMRVRNHIFVSLITIFLVTPWLSCQGYPNYEWDMVGNDGIDEFDDEIGRSDRIRKKSNTILSPEEYQEDDELKFENVIGKIQDDNEWEMIGNQVFQRPVRKSPFFQDLISNNVPSMINSAESAAAALASSSAHSLASSNGLIIGQPCEPLRQRNFEHLLGNLVATILVDVNALMELAGTIFTNLKGELFYRPPFGYYDYRDELGNSAASYVETQSVLYDFLDRGLQVVKLFRNEPYYSPAVSDVIVSVRPSYGIIARIARLKSRLVEFLALFQDWLYFYPTIGRWSLVEALKEYLACIELKGFRILDELTNYESRRQSASSANAGSSATSSALSSSTSTASSSSTSSASSLAASMAESSAASMAESSAASMASSSAASMAESSATSMAESSAASIAESSAASMAGSSATSMAGSSATSTAESSAASMASSSSASHAASSTFSTATSEVQVPGKVMPNWIARKIEAFKSLLAFLRNIPSILCEVLVLMESGCTLDSLPIESCNCPKFLASPIYESKEHSSVASSASAASSASSNTAATPPIVNVPFSNSATSASSASSSSSSYQSQLEQSVPSTIGSQSLSSASALSSSSSYAEQYPGDIGDESLYNEQGSSAYADSESSSRGISFKNIIPLSEFSDEYPETRKFSRASPGSYLPKRFSNLRTASAASSGGKTISSLSSLSYDDSGNGVPYRRSANFHTNPSVYYGQKYSLPQEHYFHPSSSTGSFNGVGRFSNVNGIQFSTAGVGTRATNTNFPLRLPISQCLIALGNNLVKVGDFIVIRLGKCALIGRLIEGADTVDFKPLKAPLGFLKKTIYRNNVVWEIPSTNFRDPFCRDILSLLGRRLRCTSVFPY